MNMFRINYSVHHIKNRRTFMKKVLFCLMVASVMMLSACSQHLGNFSALSTGTYDAKNINSSSLVKKDAVGGTKKILIFGMPVQGQPKVDEAVADALRQNNGDFMQNTSLYSTGWSVIIIGQIGYEVKGDVYKTQK